MIGLSQMEGAARVGSLTPGRTDTERRATFERLTQGRLERAYRLASVLLRDPSEAEDAVHDAALQAWARWDELRDRERFDAWFDRILVNRCRERLRRRRPNLRLVADSPERPGADGLAGIAERDALRGVLATLDADHRIVVVLRFIEDLSVAAIAERTGEREGTVKSRLHYALRQLRAAFDAAECLPGGHR